MQIGISSIKGKWPCGLDIVPYKERIAVGNQSWLFCPYLDDLSLTAAWNVVYLPMNWGLLITSFTSLGFGGSSVRQSLPPHLCEVDETVTGMANSLLLPLSVLGGVEGFSTALDWAASWQVYATHKPGERMRR